MRPSPLLVLLLAASFALPAQAAPPPRADAEAAARPTVASTLRELFSRDARVRERAQQQVEEEVEPATAEEARLVLKALSAKPPPRSVSEDLGPKYYVLLLIDSPATDEAAEVFAQEAPAAIIAAYRTLTAREQANALITLATLDTRESLAFVVEQLTARRPQRYAHAILSGVDTQTEHLDLLFPALLRALPHDETRAVAVIDLANRLVANEKLASHPAADRHDLFARWIRIHGDDELGRAFSACYALAFIPGRRSTELLREARAGHPDPFVKLEASYALAKLGADGAEKDLAQRTLDPAVSERALKYVSELGLEAYLPKEAKDPAFQARAQLLASLSQGRHYGRAPDDAALWERRTVFWPPTGDERELFLFRYRYDGADAGVESGVAVIGSRTSPLFGETVVPEGAPAREAYVAFCAWELGNSAKVQRSEEDSRALCGRFLKFVKGKE